MIHMTHSARKAIVFNSLFLALLVAAIAVLSLFIGVQELSLADLFSLTDRQRTILWHSRLPRTVSLMMAGSTLAVCGLLMQHLTQNKFVSPTTAGTMASARLGIIVAIIFFSQSALIHKTVIAFLFATLGTLVFTLFLRTVKLKNSIMVPLVGMMFGNIISSISTFAAVQYEVVQNVSSWMQGNFSLIHSGNVSLLLLTLPLLAVIALFGHYFSIMGLGKETSEKLGIPYGVMELLGISLVALATTVVILTAGSIPFVGIIIPNLLSIKKGDHFSKTLFPTALTGAMFLLVMDILARTLVFPYEIPISVVTGAVGSVLFIYLLLKGGKG